MLFRSMNALDVYKSEVMEKNLVVNRPDLCAGFEELNALMGMQELDDIEAKFVGG